MAIQLTGLQLRSATGPQLLLENDAVKNFTINRTLDGVELVKFQMDALNGYYQFEGINSATLILQAQNGQADFRMEASAGNPATIRGNSSEGLFFNVSGNAPFIVGHTDGFTLGATGTVKFSEQIGQPGGVALTSSDGTFVRHTLVPGADGAGGSRRIQVDVDPANTHIARWEYTSGANEIRFRVDTAGVPTTAVTRFFFTDLPVTFQFPITTGGLNVNGITTLVGSTNLTGLLTVDNPGSSAFIRLRPNDVVDLSWDFRVDPSGDFVLRAVTDAGATVFAPFRITHGATPITTINGSKLVAPGEITFVIDTDSGFTANGNDLINIKVAGINRFVVRGDAAPVTAVHAQSTTEALRINGDTAPFISFFSTLAVAPGRQAYLQAATGSNAFIYNLENDLTVHQFSIEGAAKLFIYNTYTRVVGINAALRLTSINLADDAVYAGFYNGDQSLRYGYIGKGGTVGNDTIQLNADIGGINLNVVAGFPIQFYTSGVRRWNINSGGTLFPEAGNTYDFGGSGNYVRTGYFQNLANFRLTGPETEFQTTSFSNTVAIGRNLQYQGANSPYDGNNWRYIGEDAGNNERGSVLIVGANGNNTLQFLSADAVAVTGGVPAFSEIFQVVSPLGSVAASSIVYGHNFHPYTDGAGTVGADAVRFGFGYFDNLAVTNPPWPTSAGLSVSFAAPAGVMGGNNSKNVVVPFPGVIAGDILVTSLSSVDAAASGNRMAVAVVSVGTDTCTIKLTNRDSALAIDPAGMFINVISV